MPYLTAVSGAFLRYKGTVLSGSPLTVTLTVGMFEIVYCKQPTGPVTTIKWYDSQGQLVGSDGRDQMVRQSNTVANTAHLIFENYTQSQGGKYECRVDVLGNISEKLPVCIGKCCTLGDHLLLYHDSSHAQSYTYNNFKNVHIVQTLLNMISYIGLVFHGCS